MKALHINSRDRTVTEVQFNGLEDLQKLVGGYIELAHLWRNGDCMFVDEHGRLEHKFSGVGFTLKLAPVRAHAGNGVVVGREVEDHTERGYHNADPEISVAELERLVLFMDARAS